MILEELEKIGLNQKESKTYLSLLELGKGSIGDLSKKSGVKRTTIYDVINSLRKKGLIEQTLVGKRHMYSAVNPRAIAEQLDDKKNTLLNVLPELLSIANILDNKPKIRFFEGDEGVREVYCDALNYPNQEILVWSSNQTNHLLGSKFVTEFYEPKKQSSNIKERVVVLSDENLPPNPPVELNSDRQIKKIPHDRFPFEVEISLYGKRNIGIISPDEKTGLIVESKKIYNTLKTIFEINWQSLKV
jgi:sugar-specific transcriptional regulator TrmB